MAERIAAYRAARTALLNEILNVLALTAAAADRESQLRDLGKAQGPRLAALEKEADAIREELIQGGWSGGNADWNDQRGWHLGTPAVTTNNAGNAEFQVLRAAAFFQKELSIDQRGLLRS